MKKIFILVFCMLFLIVNVSAFEWDNSLRYENNDMKVTIENIWGLPLFGSDLGSAELKSHKSTNEVLRFGYGEEEVVMYYDFSNWEVYEDGLGKVYFTDKRTGKVIEKDYYFVEWVLTTEKKGVYDNVLVGYSKNGSAVYEQSITWYDEDVWAWKKLENKDIPERDIRIGIKTYVSKYDYVDAVWTIAGKRIEKHASWTASLNVGLISYYKMDDPTGNLIDSLGVNNLTTNTGDYNATGIIKTAIDYEQDNSDSSSGTFSDPPTDEFAISLWVKFENLDSTEGVLSLAPDGTHGIMLYATVGNLQSYLFDGDVISNTPITSGSFNHVIFTRDSSDNVTLYVNGTFIDWLTDTQSIVGINKLKLCTQGSALNYCDGILDEIGIWNRSLSQAEVTQLYNGGSGISHRTDVVEITLNSPIESFNTTNQTINFNGTVVSDVGIINVSLYIDGILNETNSSGINNTDYLFTKILSKGDHNWTYESCNSVECTNATTRNFTIRLFVENTQLFNASSFETASETFTINITTNGTTPTTGKLIYNGTTFSSVTITNTVGNDFNISRTIDIPLTNETKSWFFNFTIGGTEFSSLTQNQIINLTNFSICDGSLTDDFLNISFKDEDDLSVLNASIPTSNFLYYLGSGTVNKTYSFSSVTNSFNYTFCATPNETLNIDSFVQYKQGTDYPQRIYNPDAISYTSTVTNITLYLLNSLDGIFVTFQVINSIEQGISGVKVTGTRVISGEDITIASGTTDAAGSVTFWLNPDFLHTFTFVKIGFETASTSLFPTQPAYTITLTGGEGTGAFDYSRGIAISTRPIGAVLNDTLYNFNYTISSSFWVLEEFGFTLSYSNGTVIGTQSSTANTGGFLGLDATTGNNGSIIMEYYYLINSTYINATSTWYIFKSNDFSIQHLLERVVTYIDADMLGVQSDDEGYFFKAVLSVFILISLTGILSTRYGLASDQAVSGIIFGVLLLLNNFNLIPTPPGTTFTNLGNFLVALVGFILVVSIFKEEAR